MKLLSLIMCSTTFACQSTTFDDLVHTYSRTIAETFHITNTRSYYPIEEKAFIKMLDSFLNQQHHHSHYLGPSEYKDLLKVTNGEFYGIGIGLEGQKTKEGHLHIIEVRPDSPAETAQLQKHDVIVAIDGNSVEQLSVDEAIKQLKGEKRHSQVTLDIMRNSKLFRVTLKRDLIKEEHVFCYFMPEFGIAYCNVSLFTNQVAQELEALLKKVALKKPKGLILDLRDNPGGVLHSAIDCAGLFLEKNSLIVNTQDRNHRVLEEFKTTRQPLADLCIPTVLLVNNFTASAAEIVAGALQSYAGKRILRCPDVFLLGTRTHGKGSVQEVIPLSADSALKLTTCLYYLPNKNSIDGKGIEPDFVIEQKTPATAETLLVNKLYGKERTKGEAAQLSVPEEKKDWKQKRIESLSRDHQLQSALHILKLYDVGKKNNPEIRRNHDKAVAWLKNNYVVDDRIKLEEL